MSRYLDLHNGRIWIRFSHDEELLAVVRALPERTFDQRERAWHVPEEHLGLVVQRLEGKRFKFTPEFRARWEEGGAVEPDPVDGWTVRQVNERVRTVVEGAFSESFWVVGELQDFDRNSKSKAAFFRLVERMRPNSDPVAEVNCVCFRSVRLEIARKLQGFDDISFRDGMKVRILVRPTIYPQKGRFQLMMEDLDPHFTAGEIERRREAVVRAMEALGIASQNKNLAMPLLPLRVALITSVSGDARQDFEVELTQSGYAFSVEVFEAAMQGTRTEETVVAALGAVAARASEFDVVCIVRGGGARSDLSFFDTEVVAEAVCKSPLKVIVGIGHERDRCALDELATRAKTPTAAAGLLVQVVGAQALRLEGLGRGIAEGAARLVERKSAQWRETALGIAVALPKRLGASNRKLDARTQRLATAARDQRNVAHRRLDGATTRIETSAAAAFREAERALERAVGRLELDRITRSTRGGLDRLVAVERRLERATTNVIRERKRNLDGADRALRLLHPDRVIERGYAMVRLGHRVVTDVADIAPESRLSIAFRDGIADVTVDSVNVMENEDE